MLGSGEFGASGNETLLLHAPANFKAKRLLVVGLGKVAKVTVHELRKAAGTAVRFAKPRTIRELALAVPSGSGLEAPAAVRAVVEGGFVGDFDPDVYRSDRKDQSIESFTVVAAKNAIGQV